MRPKITPEEVALLVEDLDMLGEQNLVGIEAYEALYLLEMRRQTANSMISSVYWKKEE
jgi:hypothetical protein